MRVAVVVQARMGSSRFPGKMLADLNGKPVLQHVLDAVTRIPLVDVILAIPDTPENDCLLDLARASGVSVQRGPEDDVLARYYHAALAAEADVVVRVTGDCPLINWRECKGLIERFRSGGYEYLSNSFPRRVVASGFECEVFSFSLLQQAHQSATEAHDREHVTPWIQRKVQNEELGAKMSIDTPEDLERVRAAHAAKAAA